MGAELKIDRLFGWRRWGVTWRLIAITTPVSILAITGLASWALGLPLAIALLLSASLAPTDPVLVSALQVGPPKTGDEDEVRFGLTSKAALNDGAAFPFVHWQSCSPPARHRAHYSWSNCSATGSGGRLPVVSPLAA